ncbi:MAG: hypothetical protein R2705_13765 [Ilumatobacteraceae bacterium]
MSRADSLVLYTGTNTPNPRVSALLASPIGSRPNLGAPGDTYNRGMEDGARLSVLASDLVARAYAAAARARSRRDRSVTCTPICATCTGPAIS